MVCSVAERQLVEVAALEEEVEVVLPGEADAAVQLQARRHDPAGGVGTPRLRRRGCDVCLAVVGTQTPCGPVRRRTHALDVDEHVRAAVLDGLEAADGLAKLYAFLGVFGCHLEHTRRAAEEGGGIEAGASVEEASRRRGAADRLGLA